jgi:hypothetical protein
MKKHPRFRMPVVTTPTFCCTVQLQTSIVLADQSIDCYWRWVSSVQSEHVLNLNWVSKGKNVKLLRARRQYGCHASQSNSMLSDVDSRRTTTSHYMLYLEYRSFAGGSSTLIHNGKALFRPLRRRKNTKSSIVRLACQALVRQLPLRAYVTPYLNLQTITGRPSSKPGIVRRPDIHSFILWIACLLTQRTT